MLVEKDGFVYPWAFEDSVDRACEAIGLNEPEAYQPLPEEWAWFAVALDREETMDDIVESERRKFELSSGCNARFV